MIFAYLITSLIIWCVCVEANQENGSVITKQGRIKLFSGLQFPKMNNNVSYADMIHNNVRPHYQELEELQNNGRRKMNAKRTIQKIIKKQKRKNRKLFFNQPSTDTVTVDLAKNILWNKNNDQSTMPSLRKKVKKFSYKVVRNPQPFSTFHAKKNKQRRVKRKIEKDNAYIIEDLDEVEFIGNSSESDIVNMHVKNYW